MLAGFFMSAKTAKRYSNPKKVIAASFAPTVLFPAHPFRKAVRMELMVVVSRKEGY